MKYLIFIFILIGCNQQQRTQRYLFEHPDFSSGYCAEKYPLKDSSYVTIDTFIQYDTVLDLDSWLNDTVRVIVNKDTVEKIVYRTRTVTVVKVIKKDSIIYRENTALVAKLMNDLDRCNKMNFVLVNKNQELEQTVKNWKGKARKRLWLIFLIIGGAMVYTFMKFKKSILT